MITRLAIREARLPEEEPYFRRFIDGLQAYEFDFEPNRRIDDAVGAEYLTVLLGEVAAKNGRVFVATSDQDEPLGWAVALVEQDQIYASTDWRTYGLISELFVTEAARGAGAGGDLIAACENYFRGLGIDIVSIGVLWGNERARDVYGKLGYSPTSLRLRKRLSAPPG